MSGVTPATERPRRRSGGVWDYVSPSRLGLWLRCPLAFRLKYVDGIEVPTSHSLFLGQMVHAGLEQYYRHRQLGRSLTADEVARHLRTQWQGAAADRSVKFESSADEQKLRQQAIDLIAAYLDQIPADELSPVAVETAMEAPLVDPLTGENLGICLVGIADLILSERGGPLIIDFKTAARSAAPLDITHEIQLSSYAYLFRQGSQQSESALEIRSLVKTKIPQVQIHRYPAREPSHFARLFAVIGAYLDDLAKGRFVFRPGLACSMCDYRSGHCQSWCA